MAIYRSVHISFWNDTKVTDDFTAEDKYFMLYLLTNDKTNLIGCYEISTKQIARDMGYSTDTIDNLLYRFEKIHKVISYDKENKEIFIKNWYKYNWNESPKLDKPLLEAIKKVKTLSFMNELIRIFNNRDTVYIPYIYPMDTTDTDTVSNTNTNIDIINIKDNNLINNIKFDFNKEWDELTEEEKKSFYNTYGVKDGNFIYQDVEDIKVLYDKKCTKKDKTISYGTYKRIKLKESQYNKLIEEFRKEVIDNQITKLDEYVEMNNNKNKYKDFNLVLRKSLRENWFNKPNYSNKKIATKPEWYGKYENQLKDLPKQEKLSQEETEKILQETKFD